MRTEGADSNLVVRRVTVFRAGANDEWALMNAKVVEAGLTEEQRAQEVKSQPFPLPAAPPCLPLPVSCSPQDQKRRKDNFRRMVC